VSNRARATPRSCQALGAGPSPGLEPARAHSSTRKPRRSRGRGPTTSAAPSTSSVVCLVPRWSRPDWSGRSRSCLAGGSTTTFRSPWPRPSAPGLSCSWRVP